MKKQYFPVFLSLEGKKCLVVGGGHVAYQKIQNLLKQGAVVKVISPQVLLQMKKFRGVKFIKRNFQGADLGNPHQRPWLVIAATDNKELNQKIYRICQKFHIWVNTVDKPETCNFIFPAVVRRGGITIAISTGGASPALAKYMRKKLEEIIGPSYSSALKRLQQLRPALLKIPMSQRKKLLTRMIESHGVKGWKNWHINSRKVTRA